MATCTRFVVSYGSVNFSMAGPRHDAIRLTFKVTTTGTRTPRYSVHFISISHKISFLISYPISGIIGIGDMYIGILLTYTAPVAEWHI